MPDAGRAAAYCLLSPMKFDAPQQVRHAREYGESAQRALSRRDLRPFVEIMNGLKMTRATIVLTEATTRQVKS